MTHLKVLNLGCGKTGLPGEFTVDKNLSVSPDLVHDLNIFPWPLETGDFDEVICHDVIEHVEDVVKTMEEIHRVSKAGAIIKIKTPHYSCANSYTDPTHLHHLGCFSFDYFTGNNQWGFYSQLRFIKRKFFLHFYPALHHKLIFRLANRWPEVYEKYWAWIFPAWFMSFELEVVKD